MASSSHHLIGNLPAGVDSQSSRFPILLCGAGTIDEIQKLHIRTVPLGEQPRRLAHQEASRTLAVGVVATDYSSADQPETAAVRRLTCDVVICVICHVTFRLSVASACVRL